MDLGTIRVDKNPNNTSINIRLINLFISTGYPAAAAAAVAAAVNRTRRSMVRQER